MTLMAEEDLLQKVLLIMILINIFHDKFVYLDLSSDWLQMQEKYSAKVYS